MADDDDLRDYLHRILVPPGFRPQTEGDIEQALDAFDSGPVDRDTVLRILRKAKGEIPLGHEAEDAPEGRIEDTVESGELLALHRSEGEGESDEVREKLENYRQQAREEDDSAEGKESDGD